MKLHVAEEFSSYPFGRDEEDGEVNGTAFRVLLAKRFAEARAKGEPLEVILDDVHALGGDFLDEAFGKFAMELKEKTGETISKKELSFHADESYYEFYIERIWVYIERRCAENGKTPN